MSQPVLPFNRSREEAAEEFRSLVGEYLGTKNIDPTRAAELLKRMDAAREELILDHGLTLEQLVAILDGEQ